MVGNDQLNVHRLFQPSVRWFSHSKMCPLLGWGAPLSNVQPYVQVYMVTRAGSQWVLPAAYITIGKSRPAMTNIAHTRPQVQDR